MLERGYRIELEHRFQNDATKLVGELQVARSIQTKLIQPQLTGTLHNGALEKLIVAGQTVMDKVHTILILGKAPDDETYDRMKRYSRIIYVVERFGLQRNLSGSYKGHWFLLNQDLSRAIKEFSTNAMEILGKVYQNSLPPAGIANISLTEI